MTIRRSAFAFTLGVAVAAAGLPAIQTLAQAKENAVKVGGAPMSPSRNLVENTGKSKEYTTLVAAVKAAGLVDTLKSPGPFTLFAPVNKAFKRLPEGTVNTLLKPENKSQLVNVLTYHVVPGKLSAEDLKSLVEKGGGKATLKTVEGGELTVSEGEKNKLNITNAKGDVGTITVPNVNQSNGVIHVIDTVLLPG